MNKMTTQVVEFKVDANGISDEFTFIVRRSASGVWYPKNTDVPPDVKKALIAWLGEQE